MVHFHAKKYYDWNKANNPRLPNTFEYTDLVQLGSIGLLKAIDKYDVTNVKGATFNTYAYWWVRSYITNHLNYHQQLIRIPPEKRDTV